MARIRGYMGISLDQYIASPDGSIDWLRKYDNIDFGEHTYDSFYKDIRTVVMGRGTYDGLVDLNLGWHYAGRRAIVVTSREIPEPIGEIYLWRDGIDALVAHLRNLDDGDAWVVGGGLLQQEFIRRGALDTLELFVVPEIVGDGIRLFPPNGFSRSVRLIAAQPMNAGMVRLLYDFPETA